MTSEPDGAGKPRARPEAEPAPLTPSADHATDAPLAARRKGRPAANAQTVGREAIVKAAMALLRVTPPAKVTREEIARFAGVNPALIRYYFGDKTNLLTAVVEAIGEENLARLKAVVSRRGSATDKLRRRIELIMQMHLENPYYHQLMFEQMWQGARPLQKRLARTMVVPFYAEFRQIIQEGQASGEFRDVDPRMVHVATLSMCELFTNAPHVLKELFRIEQISPPLLRTYSRFVTDLLLQGIGTGAAGARSRRRLR